MSYTCRNCGTKVVKKYGSGKYCSKKCSKEGQAKKTSDSLLNKKGGRDRYCKSCNTKLEYRTRKKYCSDCKPWVLYRSFFEKLGIVEHNLLIAHTQAVDLINEKYHEDKWSLPMFLETYGIRENSLYFFMNKSGIDIRGLSESITNSLLTGRRNTIPINSRYECGWHESWTGVRCYYRSSYELDYAKLLDSQKVEYYMENLKLPYFDSVKQIERVAIPDFYLPTDNVLVEIKSEYSLDAQNMLDKFVSYKEHGYTPKLYLDHEFITEEQLKRIAHGDSLTDV